MINKYLLKSSDYKKQIIKLAMLTVLQAFVILLQVFSLSKILTLLWNKSINDKLIIYILILSLAFILKNALVFLKEKIIYNFSSKYVDEIQKDTYMIFFDSDFLYKNEIGFGKSINGLLEYPRKIEEYINLITIKIVNLFIIPLIILVAMFFVDFKLALFLFFIYPVIFIFFIILGISAKNKSLNQFIKFDNLINFFVDNVRGLSTTKKLGNEKKIEKLIFKFSELYRKNVLSTLKIAFLSSFSLDFFSVLSIAVIAVFLGLNLLEGKVNLDVALFILILVPEYFSPLKDYSMDYHSTLQGNNSLNEIIDINKKIENNKDNYDQNNIDFKKNIAMDDLGIFYPNEKKESLKINNLTIPVGSKVGILGESGSGKSTFIKFMSGLIKADKDISIDNKKINIYSNKKWQKKIYSLSQSPHIFNKTIKENISFYKPNASNEEIDQVIRDVNMDFIFNLKNKENTIIGEGSLNVSAGQAQRIALSRILLDNSKEILLFDEPTSHLDTETEMDIKPIIINTFKNKTVFFATHRSNWIKEFDYLIVFREGKIIDYGLAEAVIERQQKYLMEIL